MSADAPQRGDTDVCLNCGGPITFATYRDVGSYEPDYNPHDDPVTWRHRGGYAACSFADRQLAGGRGFAEPGGTPAIDVAHLERQRAFSEATFGPGARTAGVLDHIRKELDEIAAAPDDLSEWVDVVILAFDGAWRAGHEPADILRAIVAKQTKNEQREWPDWRNADPDRAIEHVR
ncbi:MAG: DUF550 domain-containing protein [Ilumatobacter sp.]|nr:DUF550 domain-containing protein [Ilumatobacter sp.]